MGFSIMLCLDVTTNKTRLLNILITTLTSHHDPGPAWRAWIVQTRTLLLGQAREVARGEELVDQGGLGRHGGAVVPKLGDAEYYCEWN